MKVTHYLTMINTTQGRDRFFDGQKVGHINKRTRAIGLCDTWTTPKKATKDWAKVTCKRCLERKNLLDKS
jgi:hypothetical protein